MPKPKKRKKRVVIVGPEPIHEFFELSYAQYLALPRSVLQSMPLDWQQRFVKCMNELDETIDWRPKIGCYQVVLREQKFGEFGFKWGATLEDPFADYERGRRKIAHLPRAGGKGGK